MDYDNVIKVSNRYRLDFVENVQVGSFFRDLDTGCLCLMSHNGVFG